MLTVNCFVFLILLHVSFRALCRSRNPQYPSFRNAELSYIRHGERQHDDRWLMATCLEIREGGEIGDAVLIESRAKANWPWSDASNHKLVYNILTVRTCI